MLDSVAVYATQSAVSDPGRFAHLFDGLPGDPAGVASVAQGLVYHYFADEPDLGYAPPKERIAEADTRYMEAMLGRMIEMDDRPLSEPRPYDKRMIGCCRDFALLACSILRHHGVPARLRYGFAGYFAPGYWIDHVIVEVWDDGRWLRFDAEYSPERLTKLAFDIQDMPEDVFHTGGRAWQLCRDEGADVSRFGLGPNVPEIQGWWVVRGRLQLDCASLNKQELLVWDEWRYASDQAEPLSADDESLLDRAARLSVLPDSSELRAFCAGEPRLQVPATVNCWSPATGPHDVRVG